MEENYHLGPTRWFALASKLLSLFGFFLLGSFLGSFWPFGRRVYYWISYDQCRTISENGHGFHGSSGEI